VKALPLVLGVSAGLLGVGAIILGGLRLMQRSARTSHEPATTTSQTYSREDAKAAVSEGFTFKRRGETAQAIASFEAAIREDPTWSDAHHGLAQAKRDQGDLTTALASHDRAIQLDPDRFDLYWERGVTCLQLKYYEQAITNFQACLERNQRFGNAHLGLAEAYRAKGDFQSALQHHDAAIASKPDSDWFYRERGNTYRKMGEQQLADEDFARARELQQKTQ
jgi:tetratricopeptide (TPR) repeat protein